MVTIKIQKVVAYCRVSSESQIDNTSIEEQRKKIEAYCVSQDLELVKIFVDEGISASDTKNRPGYNEMMEFINDNEISGIVVYKADRIHRRLKNLLILIEDELEPKQIAFISVSEKFDTSTAQGMLFLQMIGSFGEFERKIINERTKGGRIATAKNNKYAGGQVPYGYEVRDGMVKEDSERAEIVKSVFQSFVDGDSMYKIAKRLNSEGIPTKTGKGEWTVTHIQNMLMLQTYTGKSEYNGQKEQNGIEQKNVYPRLISTQLFNKVQGKLNERKKA
jgi:site-specific DNA recombinase